MEIMAEGGGILSTMRHTRSATFAELLQAGRQRLDQMLAHGSTTVEVKTGYGLDTETELKMLGVIARLDETHPCDLVPTFLGGHTIPPEFTSNPDGYVALLVTEMIPAVASWYANSHFVQQKTSLFIDVFCEEHAFSVAQSKRILQAGINAGMKPKIHVDQFNSLGGLEMALELGAVSVDHLEVTGDAGIREIAQSTAVAVPLPAANFNLGQFHFAPARALVDAGAPLALATDMNPGSAPCFSLPLVMGIACRYQQLQPVEALNACTINGAYALGLGEKVGSVNAGKQADLLILNTPDYRHFSYFLGANLIQTIIKKGRPVS